MPWKVKCQSCGNERILNISFDIGGQKVIYQYCPYCMKNTFNDILGYLDTSEEKKEA
ncbi:hypothetical protein [Sulfuracidifex metallicus]|uniref:hypothetical protein n=1 Tax=Sulfuracidifex metallicus TaxID=47303 RepID=UPI002273E7E1|nr:hypothetical protein [Sulfuracidifex metallicus]MCY0849602.1 hypothetical protein [Sulfuracidifex metallicus]